MINSGHDEAPSNTEPLPIQDSRRFRTGSLPLKKRRLYDAVPLWELQVNNKMDTCLVPSSSYSLPGNTSENSIYTTSTTLTTTNLMDSTNIRSSNEKFAVLALVAAAATAGHTVQSSVHMNAFASPTQENVQDEHSTSSKNPSSQKSSGIDSPAVEIYRNNKAEKEGTLRPNGRVHHPPLASPLPNGCHGRTSRNNSYCRRQPCYNGSQYCKLHYQHYVTAGIRPLDDTEATLACKTVEGNSSSATTPSVTTATTAPRVVANNGQQQQQNQQLQQDKRFTGCDDEVRCEATTTRGRACAYVAVQGTRYCYLHADYDTNPPPRRGGGGVGFYSNGKPKASMNSSASSSTSTTPTTHKRVSIVGTDRLAALPETVDVAPSFDKLLYSSSPPSVTSEESYTPAVTEHHHHLQQQGVYEVSTDYLACGRLVDELNPLLSSISPDQWHGKKVRIATGPLTGRTGIVEKWGNGWVGVCVSIGADGMTDPHLHNRRALELYLLPEQDDASPLLEAQSETNSRDNAVLRRCVSREADTAEARDLMDNMKGGREDIRYSLKEARSQNSSPCFPSDTDTQDMKYDDETVDGTQRGTMIPESPMTPAHCMSNVDFSGSSFHFIPRSEVSNLDADVSRYTSTPGSTTAVTITPKPASPRRVRADEELPLVQSLMLAQEGLKRKSSLDLLFGTAALERSRRTVHKPQRYEDKAMLIRKRGREGEPDCMSPKRSSPS